MRTDPEHLGGYWIAGRLGSGGQGVVYEAYDDGGERYALKALHTAPDEREVEAARRVPPFCVSRVLAAGVDGGTPYVVSEFVAGPSLRVKVGESGPYQGVDLHRLATGAATALTAIHEAGVVHRDLTPDNVLLGPDGPKVIDFGLPPSPGRAPEPASEDDIYAWGRLTLFAATGEETGSVAALEPPLRDLVAQALDEDPDRRPSARDLLLKLLDSAGDPLADGAETARGLRTDAPEPSLGELAEQVYTGLSRAEQDAAPAVFLRLTGKTTDGQDTTRPAAALVIQRYTEAGLLHAEPPSPDRLGDGSVVLAHSALLVAWPRLREWVEGGPVVQRSVAEAAEVWQRRGRRAADLPQGERLNTVMGWAAGGQLVALSRTEREFVVAGTRLAGVRARRRGVVAGVLVALLVAALGAAGVAFWQAGTATQALAETTAKALAGTAGTLRTGDPITARLLSAAAWRLAPVAEARSALMAAATDPVRDVFADPDAGADSVHAFDQAGRWLVAVRGGTARVWDPVSKTLLMEVRGAGRSARLAALNPAGTTLAVATTGDVRVFDTRSGILLRSLPVKAALALSYQGEILSTTDKSGLGVLWRADGGQVTARPMSKLSTDGRRVLATSVASDVVAPRPPEILEGGGKLDLPWLTALRGAVTAGALGPDGTTVVLSGPSGTRVHDLASGRTLASTGPAASSLSYSPDGRLLAQGGREGIAVWQTGTWQRMLNIPDRAASPTGAASPTQGDSPPRGDSPTGGDSSQGRDTSQGRDSSQGRETEGQGVGRALVVGPSGVRYAGSGGRVRTYTVPATAQPPFGPGTRALSRDGRLLAVADGTTITLWDSGRLTATLPSTATLMAFSWDGRRLAVATPGQPSVDVWDLAENSRISTLSSSPVSGLAYSPDGRTLAVASKDWVELHAAGQVRRVSGVTGPGLVWRPDGLLLVAYDDERVYTVDPLTAAPSVPNANGKAAGVVAFNADGRMAATGNTLGHVTLWDTGLRAPLGPPLVTGKRVRALMFSRDGAVLAAAGQDGLTLWDVRTGARLGQPVEVDEPVLAQGADVLAIGADGQRRTIAVDPERALRGVCAQDGELSPAAWARYLPGLSPRKIC
ncbi:protein kinase domain-containing protein [Nonomuraea endophytica]|uniref:protein kinase domain-containing protein n=1 Tax=Nonomuraea endophytica TaxID=714136 RepID=UPI0037CA76CA